MRCSPDRTHQARGARRAVAAVIINNAPLCSVLSLAAGVDLTMH